MRKTLAAISAFLSWAVLAMPAAAQGQWAVPIYGLPMNCTAFNGQPVLLFQDPNLENIGIANRMPNGQPYIVLNPVWISQHSPLVARWWFAHECAHHALPPHANSEVNADCFGVRQMRNYGLITNRDELRAFVFELRNLPGNMVTGHLPGPPRAANIINCALT